MENNKVITRFAPSPTGYMHVGSLRTALYNFLFARKNGGKFLLRIEDTDQARFVEGADQNIIDILRYFGFNFDNEEVVFQSKRLDIYKEYAEELVARGKAYYCFCTEEELAKIKEGQALIKQPPGYWGSYRKCNKLTKEEATERIKNGEKYVIRFKMLPDDNKPEEREIYWTDLIHGEIPVDMNFQEDFIMIKSDGFPTYNFANVIDDHDMGITHIIRGDEFISSTIKYIKLYNALNFSVPNFAHLPLLLNTDKSKLSKRQGDVAVEDYLKKGYLPETIINFVALLGWNPKTEQEIFSLEELVEQFSLDKVNKSGAIFNIDKLDWFNGYYIRKMDIKTLTKLCLPYLEEAGLIVKGETPNIEKLQQIVRLEQERLVKLSDLSELVKFLFVKKLDYDPSLLIWKKMTKDEVIKNLSLLVDILGKIDSFDKVNIEKEIKNVMVSQNIGAGEILWPFRVALTGQKASPPPFDVAEVLGKTESLERIRHAVALLKK